MWSRQKFGIRSAAVFLGISNSLRICHCCQLPRRNGQKNGQIRMKENVMSLRPAAEAVTPDNAAGRPPTAVISPDLVAPLAPGRLADQALAARVARHARCAGSGLNPDEWFPVSIEPGRARQEAAAAIAVCARCPVRDQCLMLSLRHWDIGRHGVWGGLVAADRARLRARLAADRRAMARGSRA
jgi:WhiB family redox-sensing transcriptional regulator